MQIKDMIPWARDKKAQDGSNGEEGEEHPVAKLQDEMNRAFEGFWNRMERPFSRFNLPWSGNGSAPRSDVVETDDAIEVSIELPGMEQKDVEVTLTDDRLTVKGERKVEHQEQKKGYYLSERSYGMFERTIPLPPGIDTDKADAVFKNGVLTVKMPQSPEAKAKVKRIEVKAA